MKDKDNGVKRDYPINRRIAGRSDDRDQTADNAAERKTPREDAAETTGDCTGAGPRRGSRTEPTADNSIGSRRNSGQSVLLTDGGPALAVSKDGLLEQALDLTNFQITQLTVAAGEAQSGQQILRELNDQPFENEITHGRLYPNLDVLYEAGVIEKRERDRRTNEYPTSTKGDALLSAYGDWLLDRLRESDARSAEITPDAKRLSFQLTHFQIGCLASLTGGRVSGQDAKADLEDASGEEINHGRLYPNLDTVVENGCVQKDEIDRRTNGYELTDLGRGVLAARLEWLRDQGAVDGNGGGA